MNTLANGGYGGGGGGYDSKMTSSYDRLPTSQEQQQDMINSAKYFNEKVVPLFPFFFLV